LKYSVRQRLNTNGKWITDITLSDADAEERDDLIIQMSEKSEYTSREFENSWNRCFQIGVCFEVDSESAMEFIVSSNSARA
jgi:hypothetical protein